MCNKLEGWRGICFKNILMVDVLDKFIFREEKKDSLGEFGMHQVTGMRRGDTFFIISGRNRFLWKNLISLRVAALFLHDVTKFDA